MLAKVDAVNRMQRKGCKLQNFVQEDRAGSVINAPAAMIVEYAVYAGLMSLRCL
jgi:hypothetical protein